MFDAPAKVAAPKPAVDKQAAPKEISGGFGMFGAPSKPAAPDTKAADERKAAEARAVEQKRQEAEAKRALIADEKRRKAEEAKASAAAASEARRVEAEQKRQKAEAAKAAAAEEKRRIAEDNRKKADMAKAAADTEAKRKEAEQKKAAAVRAKQAQESVKQAKPRSTFSLTALFGGSADEGTKAEKVKPATQPQAVSVAPKGVATISEWKQNRDGSITGRVSGGVGFKDGEKIETSPIGGKAIGGAVVQTASGSR
jgi:membrane protein involved in colicin uptake